MVGLLRRLELGVGAAQRLVSGRARAGQIAGGAQLLLQAAHLLAALLQLTAELSDPAFQLGKAAAQRCDLLVPGPVLGLRHGLDDLAAGLRERPGQGAGPGEGLGDLLGRRRLLPPVGGQGRVPGLAQSGFRLLDGLAGLRRQHAAARGP